MRIGEHDTHELADVFPLLIGAELDGLIDDIRTNGLRTGFEITLIAIHGHGAPDLILDGRNRYIACLAAGVAPRFRYYDGDESDDALMLYVLSVNHARRNLDGGQRALVVRRLAKLIRGERKRRQPQLPGVALATSEMADGLIADGIPDLVAAVDRGDIPLAHAAAVAKLEPEQQREVIARVERAEPEPSVRAHTVDADVWSVAVRLTPVDVASIKAALFVLEKSPHNEVRHAVGVIRKVMP